MASTFTILQEGYVPSKPHINIHLEDGNYGTGMDGFFIIATAEKPVNSNLTIKGTVYAMVVILKKKYHKTLHYT